MTNIFKHDNLRMIILHHLLLIYGIYTYGFNIWVALGCFIYTIIYNVYINGKLIHLRMAHGRYRDNFWNIFATIYSLFAGGTGSPLSFSYIHRQHHKFVDTERDPHSPKYVGKLKVWFLMWRLGPMEPSYIRDFMKSKFQVWIHRNWTRLQVAILIGLWLINPLIVLIVITPTIVMTLHYSGFINVRGHWYGEVRNIPEIRFTQPASWRHKEHHDYKFE